MYKPPTMDISTAAYDDIELILERIEEELIGGKGMEAVLCVGDSKRSRACGILSWTTLRRTSGASLAVVIFITSSTWRRG